MTPLMARRRKQRHSYATYRALGGNLSLQDWIDAERRERAAAWRRQQEAGSPLALAVLYGLIGLSVGVTFTLLAIGIAHGGLAQ